MKDNIQFSYVKESGYTFICECCHKVVDRLDGRVITVIDKTTMLGFVMIGVMSSPEIVREKQDWCFECYVEHTENKNE